MLALLLVSVVVVSSLGLIVLIASLQVRCPSLLDVPASAYVRCFLEPLLSYPLSDNASKDSSISYSG